jgi:UDP-N-acetylmuramoylalanine--D-glutamate ligase
MTSNLIHNTESSITPVPGAWWVVFGLGATGLSCARFLSERGVAVTVVDTRDNPPQLTALRRELPKVEVCCGQLPLARLLNAEGWLLSPGVPLDHPAVIAARRANIPLLGDVELFARYATAPYVGITGSNGKSTVTTLVAEMIAASGRLVAAGANLGTPALDLLARPTPDYYVLELSSFQLEITDTLAPVCAAILNLSADHLDRHHSFEAYAAAKARILRHANCAVLNVDDPYVAALATHFSADTRWVSLDSAKRAAYTIEQRDDVRWLCANEQAVIPSAALKIKGTHNEFNALAALAITDSIHIPRAAQVDVLQRFSGLEHRCRLVAECDGITWFNDSKGTNIGAAAASITGIFNSRRGVLIAGGQGKGADFRELRTALVDRVHSVVLIGEDAPQIAAAVKDVVDVHHARDMRGAVEQAAQLSRPGEAVLLSPACASFDMFRNYAARGWAFEAAVRELLRQ